MYIANKIILLYYYQEFIYSCYYFRLYLCIILSPWKIAIASHYTLDVSCNLYIHMIDKWERFEFSFDHVQAKCNQELMSADTALISSQCNLSNIDQKGNLPEVRHEYLTLSNLWRRTISIIICVLIASLEVYKFYLTNLWERTTSIASAEVVTT